ncbi:hypothetical protein SprV_0100260000 [Sparganum proliferum]
MYKVYMDNQTGANKAVFFHYCRLAQQRLRKMQDAGRIRKAEKIQEYANCNETKNLFTSIGAVYGFTTQGTAPLLSPDRTAFLTEKSPILKCWVGHFIKVLKRPSTVSDAATDRIPQMETNNGPDPLPSLPEKIRTVHQLFGKKIPSSDAIPNKCFKHSDLRLMDHLKTLFQEIWHSRQLRGFRGWDSRPSLQAEGKPATEESVLSTSPGRSPLASPSNVSVVTSNRDFCRKASVAFDATTEPLT